MTTWQSQAEAEGTKYSTQRYLEPNFQNVFAVLTHLGSQGEQGGKGLFSMLLKYPTFGSIFMGKTKEEQIV